MFMLHQATILYFEASRLLTKYVTFGRQWSLPAKDDCIIFPRGEQLNILNLQRIYLAKHPGS